MRHRLMWTLRYGGSSELPNSRRVEFTADTILKLAIHYAQGELPLDSEVKEVQVSAILPRWVCFVVESKDWEGTPFNGDGYGGVQPFMFRYESKRVLNLSNTNEQAAWGDEAAIEAPKRTD